MSPCFLLTSCRAILIRSLQAFRIRSRCDWWIARSSQFRQIFPFHRHIAKCQLGSLSLHPLNIPGYRSRIIQPGMFLRRSLHHFRRQCAWSQAYHLHWLDHHDNWRAPTVHFLRPAPMDVSERINEHRQLSNHFADPLTASDVSSLDGVMA